MCIIDLEIQLFPVNQDTLHPGFNITFLGSIPPNPDHPNFQSHMLSGNSIFIFVSWKVFNLRVRGKKADFSFCISFGYLDRRIMHPLLRFLQLVHSSWFCSNFNPCPAAGDNGRLKSFVDPQNSRE